MKHNYCIIGTGRQGRAAAYDLLKFANINELLLLDSNENSIHLCLEKIKSVKKNVEIKYQIIDLNNIEELTIILKDYDIFLSSVPYRYNLLLTQVAVESKTSMVDLGGHTGNVIKQLQYNSEAKDKGITIVPDCGMGPGMNVTMALFAMEHFDKPLEVRIWDGGLPLNPKPPWNYSLFFNIEGLTNEYDEQAYFLKDGEIVEVPCFDNIENVSFDNIGELEAAVTSGGLSTMPWTFKNKLKVLENKTLRYKGHWEWMKAYRELGLFSREVVDHNGTEIVPRHFYHQLLEKKIDHGRVEDVCLMRIKAIGFKDSKKIELTIDAVEYYNQKLDLTAMEKWTGWHISIMALEIAYNKVSNGAISVENALKGHTFLEEARNRGYDITINTKEI